MLTNYIRAAMRQAQYEILSDDGTFYGEIPGFDGVYANTDTLEACREEPKEVLDEPTRLTYSQSQGGSQDEAATAHNQGHYPPWRRVGFCRRMHGDRSRHAGQDA